MTVTRQFRTNLRCDSCVAALKPQLDREPSIARWSVDVADPDKVLTVEGVEGDDVSSAAVEQAVARAGYRILGSLPSRSEEQPVAAATDNPSETTTYYPLVLLVAFLVGVVTLVEIRAGAFDGSRAMGNIMGAFFLAFSFFKLLDLRGFADAFRMYDLPARHVAGYAYAYPFVEMLLGAAYVAAFQPFATNLVTLVVMGVGSIGVLRSLLNRRKIRCACLGTVFNLPMSTVTLVEDGLMVVMAAASLIGFGH